MSKKRKTSKPAAKPRKAPAPQVEAVLARSAWPEEFAPPRVAWMMGGVVLFFAIALVSIGLGDSLTGFKQVLAEWFGVFNPAIVKTGSWDLALVALAMISVAAAGVVHPVLGLVILAFFRPWLDGYTYKTDNAYFIWAIVILYGLWALRVMWRGEPFRFLAPAALLGAFIAVAAALMPAGVCYDGSYRSLLFWLSYLFLFILTANSLRSRRLIGILLAGLCASMAMQTIYALLHFYYLLPQMRQMIQDPDLLEYFFHTRKITPEIARRFNVNRAFGSLLFPNALAAFLVLGIPFCVAGAVQGWRALVPAWDRKRPSLAERRRGRDKALVAAVFAVLAVGAVLFATVQFRIVYYPGKILPIYYQTFPLALLVLLAGGLVGAVVFAIADQRGMGVCGLAIQAVGLSLLAVLELWALWLTYSRGAYLSLGAAALFLGLLYLMSAAPGAGARLARPLRTAALVLLCALALGWIFAPRSAEAQPGNTANQEAIDEEARLRLGDNVQVTEDGIDVSGHDLTNLKSASLRFSYWRVGLAMWADHPWTGVGLGNFGKAYPAYQYLGAGDVREAHNGYLQALCETGILGGLLLAAFWGGLLLWGAWRVTTEQDTGRRLLLAGLYGGLVAFAAHSFLDINFAHPSLVMYAMLFAGAFLALCGVDDKPRPKRSHRWLAAATFAVALLMAGMMARVYFHDLCLSRFAFINVEDPRYADRQQRLAQGVLTKVRAQALDRKRIRPVQLPLKELMLLVPGPKDIAVMGDVYAPVPGSKSARKLRPGQPLPQTAFLNATESWSTFNRVREATLAWTAWLEELDKRYPHTPEIAARLAQMNKLLAHVTAHPKRHEDRMAYVDAFLHWAEELRRRSTIQSDVEATYGRALSLAGQLDPDRNAREFCERALAHFDRATKLAPNAPGPLFLYADALRIVADKYEGEGNAAQAKQFRTQSGAVTEQAKELQQKRWSMGMS